MFKKRETLQSVCYAYFTFIPNQRRGVLLSELGNGIARGTLGFVAVPDRCYRSLVAMPSLTPTGNTATRCGRCSSLIEFVDKDQFRAAMMDVQRAE
jgi:hypothetical protein